MRFGRRGSEASRERSRPFTRLAQNLEGHEFSSHCSVARACPKMEGTNRASTAAIAAGALGITYLAHRWYRARASPRVLVLVSGTLQDGFPLRRNLDSPGAPATFLGWALVRGVKMYLDPKPRGCREWVDPEGGERQRVNPALVCTGANTRVERVRPQQSKRSIFQSKKGRIQH